MRLDHFDNSDFDRGRPMLIEICWRIVEGLFFDSWLPGSGWRLWLLRVFGASLGRGVIVKPHVRVKFPWKLKIGNHSWIGEDVWIDNLDWVDIGSHCCVSQGAYLCTGSHRWDSDTFDLDTGSIVIADRCWIGAMTRIAPNARMGEGAVATMGSVVIGEMPAWMVCSGNPAQPVKARRKAD
jgi:putative colanic acid biosynthesis acetyltransferase WcaF